MSSVFFAVLQRDWLLVCRRPAESLTGVMFFILVASLFPLATSPDPQALKNFAPAVLWVSALLACLLSLPRLFASDYIDGTLEQMLLAPQSLSLIVVAKVVAHWLSSSLPLILLSPMLGLLYGLDSRELIVLVIGLLLGTPTLSLLGGVGAALTLGARGGGILLSVLILPLYIPVLIFGAGAVVASQQGLAVQAYFSLLGACLLLSFVLAPWATATALKIVME